jgi:hypothetical protein
VLSSTYAGRRIVPLERFDAVDWLTLARDEAMTHAMVVPRSRSTALGWRARFTRLQRNDLLGGLLHEYEPAP